MHLLGLRTRLILILLLLVFLPMVGMGLYGRFFTSQALSQNAREQTLEQVSLHAAHITHMLEHARDDLNYLGALRSVQRYQQAGADEMIVWRDEITQDFLLLASMRPMYYRIRYVDRAGDEIVSILNDGDQVSEQAVMFRSETQVLEPGDTQVSSFILDRDIPLVRYAGRLETGIVILDIHVGWLLQEFPKTGEAESWGLIDQNGTYLLYVENYPFLSEDNRVTLLNQRRGSLEVGDRVLVYDTVELDDGTFWIIYNDMPHMLFYADIGEFYHTASIYLLGAFLLAVGLAMFSSNQIMAPIRELQRTVERFGEGQSLPDETSNLPHDEIGALTQSFRKMAHELERKRQQERRLIEQLITAQEEERKRVAYDLHDGLIQQLVGARLHLTTCRSRCPVDGQGDPAGLRRTCDALTEAIVEGRRIIEGLHPAVLDDLGLVEALAELAHTCAENEKWTMDLQLKELPFEPDITTRVTLYRIAQEALSNVRKHAQASSVRLSLSNDQGISLTIEDDGQGFDPLLVEQTGLGITTMHERASLIGGNCKIASRPTGGTRVEVWVPLPAKERV